MSSNERIQNITRGYSMRAKQALRGVENCAMAWVEYGVSVRDLTLAESIAARAAQAKDREPLPLSEVFGIKVVPPMGAENAHRESRLLAFEASLFAAEVA